MMETHSYYRNVDVAPSRRKTRPTSQTADRALSVLRLMLAARRPLALSEIAQASGLAASSTHRLLASLVHQNFARQDAETSKYSLGLGLLEFGYAILNDLDVRELAAPALTELNHATGETVHLAILDAHDLVYIDRRDTHHGVRVHTSIGRRGTPHTTGVGKALLAYLSDGAIDAYLARVPLAAKTARSITDPQALRAELARSRARGYATDDGEDKDHVCCIAAPILGGGGEPLAAISISVPDSRLTLAELTAFAPLLLEHVLRLRRDIGYRSGTSGGQPGRTPLAATPAWAPRHPVPPSTEHER
jgi:IclR family transcriptional regulator, KDG regulon repressor